ncbi:hypothetical protein ACTFIZ_008762 [Dictyostelium cf. discoideum]
MTYDESSITSECYPVKKGQPQENKDSSLIFGSTVIKGFCTMSVTAIGVNSFNTASEDTQLQVFASSISLFGMGASILMLLIVTQNVSFNIEYTTLQLVISAIIIVIVSVPEGSLFSVTVTLTFKVKQDNIGVVTIGITEKLEIQ